MSILGLGAVTALMASPAAATSIAFETSSQPSLIGSSGAKSVSGTRDGLTWTAASRIIGQTPTSNVPVPPATGTGGGDPIYKPSANKSGVVALIMTYANGSRFICSGSLLGDGMSIATAGHCVSGGAGTPNPVSTTAYFFDGNADARTPFKPGGYSIDVSKYIVNEGYTGEVIDQNDIAILRLEHAASRAFERYDLFTADLTGEQFNVAGYGTRSNVGGASGNTPPANAQTGYLREGDNIYDYAWGNPLFQGFFTDIDPATGENFFGTADVEFSFISDFDNGLAAQSQATRIANALGLGPIGTANFADLGLGEREVNIAGGDSGGPGFIDGKLSSINSYGLTFGAGFGDFGGGLNSGWGEFSGYVPIFIHTDFIAAAMAVPEPGTWAMLIAGFGLTGASMRRRRAKAITLNA
nr:PEPxxWA-CTERM sorting domain-containing protein [Polymorphobacter glacialis]